MRGGLVTSGRWVGLWRAARRRCSTPRGGFTIIEVLIVLAVTGALFLSAALMISGKQAQTAFDQSIREIQSQVQQSLNEVGAGFYPNNNNFKCAVAGVGQPPTLSAAAVNQGTNSGCIFLGKAIQFGVGSNDPDRFSTYTIAALQNFGSCATEPACLAAAKPVVVAPSNPSHNTAGYPDNSNDEELHNGLKAVRAWYNNGAGDVEIGAIAFVSSLAQYGATGGLVSGASSVNIVAIDGTALGASKQDLAELLNSDGGNKLAAGTINPSGGVYVCFESGGTQDYGIIQIGGNGRDLAVNLVTKDKGGATCTYP
ncbi:MAG TPA: prepilin-type N-terminal cleavage/methylation domain-containing protein [Candidatus Pristimantibacillus sp.]|nr:prepilin-type N-terminal cleavage/methylation domain-containing protein [Candidatus Pristimantibacillus sp.]